LPDSGQAGRIWLKWPESGRPLPDLVRSGRIRPLIRPDPAGYDWILPLIGPDLAKMAGIRPDMTWSGRIRKFLAGSGQTFSPESGSGDRMLLDSGSICPNLIFAFCKFFVRAKHWKYFQKNHFF